MPLTPNQKVAIEEVIQALVSLKSPRIKRQLAAIFLDLPDRTEYPHYYEVIPEPRCINNIRSSLEKNRYKEALDAYTDLSLVFWNALYYNEPLSQIATDAEALKSMLQAEWKKRTVLPIPRSSPPSSAPQKVHPPVPDPGAESQSEPEPEPEREQKPTPAGPMPARVSTSMIQPASADMDVDVVDVSSEVDGAGLGDDSFGARNGEGEEIVRQLEIGLPKWGGFGDLGWMTEGDSSRYQEIVHDIKSYKDVVGNRLAVCLEALPEESSLSTLSYSTPLSLKIIESRARSNAYERPSEFDKDMSRLFEKARHVHPPASEPYTRALLLQRFYNALTSACPIKPPYTSTTNFASLRAGPGNVSDADAGVTTFRVSSKDRTFVEEIWYKGISVKLADWVHLSNPDDPGRPIVAQVFRVWVSDELTKKGQPRITACWYFRPEQTFHPSRRQFWKNEVFKTSHFADHPVEDLIEKIACQFTARHIRGRPRAPYWYPGWPLYMCDSRYNDRERAFVRIKNWNSCIPEEVRKSEEFMPIYLFERTVFPNKYPSPFLGPRALKGPGGIDENVGKEQEGDKDKEGGGQRKRITKRATAGDGAGKPLGAPSAASGMPYYGLPQYQQHQHVTQNRQQSDPIDRSVTNAAGGLAALGNNVHIEKLTPETAKHFDRDPDTNEVLWFAAPPMNIARPTAPKHSLTYLHFLAMKRKKEAGGTAGDDEDAMDVDEEGGGSSTNKRRKEATLSVTETLRNLATSGFS